MTKSDFVSLVASKANFKKKDAEVAVESFLDSVSEVLKNGDSVTFVGFGTFSITQRSERVARVPSTGKEIKVPAKKAVKFKVGKTLKDSVAATTKKATKKK